MSETENSSQKNATNETEDVINSPRPSTSVDDNNNQQHIITSDSIEIPIVQVYLRIHGDLQPGASTMQKSLKGDLIPFVPAMVDSTLEKPNIYFMPTIRMSNTTLKHDEKSPMQVIDSTSEYIDFLKRASNTNSIESTRAQLFDNVKHNIEYIRDLYLPIGGKITLPQMASGSSDVQGFETYRIEKSSQALLELPASALPFDTRQTLVSELYTRLREAEHSYKIATDNLSNIKPIGNSSLETVDTEHAKKFDKLIKAENDLATANKNLAIAHDKLLNEKSKFIDDITNVNNELSTLKNKYPDPNKLDDKSKQIYEAEKDKLNNTITHLKSQLDDANYYLSKSDKSDEEEDEEIHMRPNATKTMENYVNAIKNVVSARTTKIRINRDHHLSTHRVRASKAINIKNTAIKESFLEKQHQARIELFKKQEELNAAKGGWLIDRKSLKNKSLWITTANGLAFPRVYNVLYDITVSYHEDNVKDQTIFAKLDCINKGRSIDERLSILLARNPKAPVTIFENFIKTYEPDKSSPYASPTAFTRLGKSTAQTPKAKMLMQKMQLRERAQNKNAQAIREAMARRKLINNVYNTPLTLNNLQSYGLVPNLLNSIPAQHQQSLISPQQSLISPQQSLTSPQQSLTSSQQNQNNSLRRSESNQLINSWGDVVNKQQPKADPKKKGGTKKLKSNNSKRNQRRKHSRRKPLTNSSGI